MTTIGPETDLDLDPDTLPAPGTDEGWAALAAEATRNGYADPQAYVAAYASGHVNVGIAGYRPGDPHTGFGQVQAYEHAAGVSGLPLDQYAAMHTPEALAEARGEAPPEPPDEPDPGDFDAVERPDLPGDDRVVVLDDDGAGQPDQPFTPPANFTADGIPIEYGPDGTSIVPNIARLLPDGVDQYDRYTGAPLDEDGNIVPGVAYADDGYVFTSALDQRIGLNDEGSRDPAETERLDAEARAAGYDSAADQVLDTTRPFPGHPGEPGDLYARPTVEEGRPPVAYSGPDGIYVVTSGGTVLTGEPGGEIEYRGEDGSAVIIPGLKVVTTAPDGTTVSFDPSETSGGPGSVVEPGPPVMIPDDTVLDADDLGPIHDDFPDLIDTDGDGLVDAVRPGSDGSDGPDASDGNVYATDVRTTVPEGTFGSGHQAPVTQGGFAEGADVPDPRVTTTAGDLGAGSGHVGSTGTPAEEHDLDSGGDSFDDDSSGGSGATGHDESSGSDHGSGESGQDADHDTSSDSPDLDPTG